jgi:hypothetical protein
MTAVMWIAAFVCCAFNKNGNDCDDDDEEEEENSDDDRN